MASTSAAASGSAMDIEALKTQIYEALTPLQLENPQYVFHQQDVFDLDIVPTKENGEEDIFLAMRALQSLTNEKLLKLVTDPATGWKVRSREDASRWRGLTSEEEMVYSYIDDSGTDGAWTRNLKMRTGLHDAIIQTTVKKLKAKNLITEMKSVEHPTRKMYIKSNLSPSERATGGAWYTDNELDEVLIEHVAKVVFTYIFNRTLYFSKSFESPYLDARGRVPKKTLEKKSTQELIGLRNMVLDAGSGGESSLDKSKRLAEVAKYHPMPSGFQGYPTLEEMTRWIDSKKVVTEPLTAVDLQQLLDVMVFDNKIESVATGNGTGYRVARKSLMSADDRRSVLMEAPCGRCPVFELCEEGGPVGPSNCEYFNEWLSL